MKIRRVAKILVLRADVVVQVVRGPSHKGSVWRNVTTVVDHLEIDPTCALLCLDFDPTYFGKSVISVFEDRQRAFAVGARQETTIGDQWWLLGSTCCVLTLSID